MAKEMELELHYDERVVNKKFLKEFDKLAKRFHCVICEMTEDDVATDCFWEV